MPLCTARGWTRGPLKVSSNRNDSVMLHQPSLCLPKGSTLAPLPTSLFNTTDSLKSLASCFVAGGGLFVSHDCFKQFQSGEKKQNRICFSTLPHLSLATDEAPGWYRKAVSRWRHVERRENGSATCPPASNKRC